MPVGTVIALVVAALVAGMGLGALWQRRGSAASASARRRLEQEVAALHAALEVEGGFALWSDGGAEPLSAPRDAILASNTSVIPITI